METLVPPHGGVLTERIVSSAEELSLREIAAASPSLVLDARELADLELMAVGAASPLRGFLGAADYESVLARMRLADGTVWPLPLTLAVSDEDAARLERGSAVALRDGRGFLWAVLTVSEVHRRDPLAEARAVYRTEDAAHPGVAYLLSRPVNLVAGEVRAFPLPDDLPFAAHRRQGVEARRGLPDAQSHPPRPRAPDQARARVHRRHRHPSARRRDQGR